jgi:hypothetical protein
MPAFPKYTTGWHQLPGKQGGPFFVTARSSAFTDAKAVWRYSLTDKGWAGLSVDLGVAMAGRSA